jgi:hypothetical protein
MAGEWQFQIRLTASEELSSGLRNDASAAIYAPLGDVLRKYHASTKCQFDAFADYVSEAERVGTAQYPLYQWAKETIGKPEKRARYLRSFTLYVNGAEVYDQAVADPLYEELMALVGSGGIENVVRLDTNPANNPQPPAR